MLFRLEIGLKLERLLVSKIGYFKSNAFIHSKISVAHLQVPYYSEALTTPGQSKRKVLRRLKIAKINDVAMADFKQDYGDHTSRFSGSCPGFMGCVPTTCAK